MSLVIAGHSHSEALGVPPVPADGRTELAAHPDDARFACAAGVSPRDERCRARDGDTRDDGLRRLSAAIVNAECEEAMQDLHR